MPFIIHREKLGGYLGLIMPFDSFFDTRADTAFMRDCGVGVRSHCQKETSHKEGTLSLLILLTKDCIRATCALIYVVGGISESQEIPWENSGTSVITFHTVSGGKQFFLLAAWQMNW